MILKRIIPLILVLMILAAGAFYLLTTEREEINNMKELYRQTEPLQRQKDELLARKETLAENFKAETRDVSTVQILFRKSHMALFTHVYPLMRDRGITGVIGMTRDDYPGIGYQNRITLEQYNRLIMDGWGSCLIYDGSTPLESFLRNMKEALNHNNLDLPTTIFFSEKKSEYDAEAMDPVLLQYGIHTVVRNSSDGHSETVSEVGEIWHTGAMPWNYTGVNADLELLASTDGGNLTLTASFDDIWDGLMKESTAAVYKPETAEVQNAFVAFLDVIQAMLDKESSLLTVTPTPSPSPTPGPNGEQPVQLLLHTVDYDTARLAHLQAQTNNENRLAEYQQMQADLDAQIAELDRQIAAIYTAFNIKSSTSMNENGSGESA